MGIIGNVCKDTQFLILIINKGFMFIEFAVEPKGIIHV